ncbi:MraY family glycosyltransferase [Candidatus Methylocalor cossyra]|uniref:Undecaprenyl-phosphate N-acetylglucosaminyl 1-phosphate transferase n=1 Tax=Candidatus Methylocalor cossyra TaxID=3108543 RepID=A0ABM9NJI5_9GAMM
MVTSFLGLILDLAALTLLSAGITYVVRGYALERLVDLPNARSSHRVPTPRGGGVAIVAVFALAAIALYGQGRLALSTLMALSGALPVAAIGFWDDHGHVSPRWRLLVQFAAAGWALYWIGGFDRLRFGGDIYPLGGAGPVLGALFIVWMVNLYNFMDGIDGLAGGEAITATLSAAWLLGLGGTAPPEADALRVAALALAAATGGFLVWNWPPAKIFMGDVGSGFVGFLLGLLALHSAAGGGPSLAVWLILLGVFCVDATLTLARRVVGGQPWYQAHCSHAYQHAARRWAGHRPVTLAVLAINLVWLLPWAWAAVAWPRWEGAFLVAAYAPLVGLAAWLDAGKS